jgi:hypothetical protein
LPLAVAEMGVLDWCGSSERMAEGDVGRERWVAGGSYAAFAVG